MRSIIALLAILVFQCSAHAAIVKYTNFAQWQTAAGSSFETIAFEEYSPGTVITNQYSHLGATLIDGNDWVFDTQSFVMDGMGIYGGEGGFLAGIRINFDAPIHAFSIHHPGTSQFYLYRDGIQIHTETIWFLGAGTGNYSGIVSTETFDSIRIISPADNSIFIDNMYFTPGPSALGVFALAGVCLGGRRRTP